MDNQQQVPRSLDNEPITDDEIWAHWFEPAAVAAQALRVSESVLRITSQELGFPKREGPYGATRPLGISVLLVNNQLQQPAVDFEVYRSTTLPQLRNEINARFNYEPETEYTLEYECFDGLWTPLVLDRQWMTCILALDAKLEPRIRLHLITPANHDQQQHHPIQQPQPPPIRNLDDEPLTEEEVWATRFLSLSVASRTLRVPAPILQKIARGLGMKREGPAAATKRLGISVTVLGNNQLHEPVAVVEFQVYRSAALPQLRNAINERLGYDPETQYRLEYECFDGLWTPLALERQWMTCVQAFDALMKPRILLQLQLIV